MKFGIFFSYQRLSKPRTDDPLYEETLAEAIKADDVGFDEIWLPEHHLTPYFQAPSAFMAAIQIGLNVSCRIGTMASVLPYHHPLKIAGEIAVADRILQGRFDAGLARGAWAHEFRKFGLDFSQSSKQFLEELEILKRVWSTDQAISFDGEFYSFEKAAVWPRPLQSPHPPIWIAAQSDQTIEYAARSGFNVATWPHHNPMDLVRHRVQVFREATAGITASANDQKISVMRVGFVTDDAEEQSAAVEMMLDNFRVNRLYHNDTAEEFDEYGYISPRSVPDEPTLEEMTANLLVGDPKTVLAKVLEYHEMGVDQLILHLSFGLPHEATLAGIERFGREVIAPYRAMMATGGGRLMGLDNGHGELVDWHTHVWLPEHLAKWGENLDVYYPGTPSQAGAYEEHVRAMDEGGVAKSLVIALKSRHLDFDIPNEYISAYVALDPERRVGFASVDPQDPGAVEKLRYAVQDLRLRGLKLAPPYMNFHPHSPAAWRIYVEAQRLGIPIMFHQSTVTDGAGALTYANPILLDDVLRAFPEVKVIIAHAGQPWTAEVAALMRKHRNLYTDLSGRCSKPWQLFHALRLFIEGGVVDRVLFGSDFPANDPIDHIAGLRQVNDAVHAGSKVAISEDVIEGILYDRPLSLVGL